MPSLRCGFPLLLLASSLCTVSSAQDQTNFPTDYEIKLLLTQTERAVDFDSLELPRIVRKKAPRFHARRVNAPGHPFAVNALVPRMRPGS